MSGVTMERKITRIYTGTDGESHFEDMVIPIEEKRGIGLKSELIKATGVIFGAMDENYEADWHNAPRRQFVITLEGEAEVEIGDGTKRRFRPGDVLLAEDTTGRGHISRGVNNQPRRVIFVTLD